ncbi:DNA transposase THAP9 isoform X2 [Mixophyes fleayi]|uniref:DNA transposase THAP9 isoform X2 n=1 Tax=Mixophyes fleayi TaxID=3061075 RepID=UPI003F4DFB86
MPVSCAASGCKSRYTLEAREKGITFHRFPRSNPVLLDKWCRAMKRATVTGELWTPSRYQRLCSLHFQQSCFDTTGQTKRLRDDVIPSIFNFPEEIQNEVPESKVFDVTPPCSNDIPIVLEAQNGEPDEGMTAVNIDTSLHCQVQLQDHPYVIPDIETLKKKLQASEDSRAQKEKELRNAKDREKRLRQTFLSIYQELNKRNLLSSQLLETLQPYEDIPLELFRKPESEYTAQQRLFSLTLQLNDPLSYRYLKKEIKLPLPGPRRLRQWLKSDRESPGLNSSVLEALLQKKQTHPHLYTRTCIVVDTLSLQQNVTFNSQQNEFVGFVNLGTGGVGSGSQEVANEVLMFMLVGTSGHWKSPVAYFFVKSLTPQAQKQLLVHVLQELCENGIEIVAVLMERNPRNEEMCTLLGCAFTDPCQLQTHFSLPNSDYKHYVVFDVCYELQTVTDTIEELGSIQSADGVIMWQYINDLMNIHKTTCMFPQLAKLSLLVNKLSDTVANALKFIQELNTEEFDGFRAIVSFIQIIGRLFDIFNSSSVRIQGDKGPVNHANLEQKLQILQETREYLLTLMTCDNVFLFQTSRAWCTVGLLVNITSITELLPYLLMDQDYVTTYRFQTHHLKEFFNSIRNTCGGSHLNPTALDVKFAVEKLLSEGGFIDLCVKNKVCFVHKSIGWNLPGYLQNIPCPFEETSIRLPGHIYSSCLLDVTVNNSEMFIAGWVVRKAFRQLSCNKCRWALVTDDRPQDFTSAYHLLQVKGGTTHFVPSNGTFKTVQTAEKELYHMLKYDYYRHSASALMLEYHVLLTLGPTDIFNLKEHIAQTELNIDNHHFHLVRLLTSLYYALRKPYIAKITEANKLQALVKQTLTRSQE